MPTIMRNGVATHISVEEYNEVLSKQRKDVLGVDEATGKLKHFEVEDLGKIWINGQEFSGMAYQGLLTVNTKTYVEEPKRANDGSIPNINDYDTFVVPRCKVNFKYFNIYDYQRLCDAVQSNEFTVKYYDKQFNEFVVHKMYCEPEEMAKLYNVETDVFGVLDYEVSFIGTLNDLQEYTVTYDSNGGTIAGNPTLYNVETTYKKGDRVYLADNRYFEAIYYLNSFKNEDGSIALTNTTYWKPHNLSLYGDSTTYSKGDISYKIITNDKGEESGRNYYIAISETSFSGRPLTDINYWQPISAKIYSNEKTYSSNRVSREDTTLGQFALNSDGSAIYEAIYFVDTFSGQDPTNGSYWKQLALGTGVTVKWGNSIVVADPEELFDISGNVHSYKWNTRADGGGFTYYPSQSLNVFKNLKLYAIWE